MLAATPERRVCHTPGQPPRGAPRFTDSACLRRLGPTPPLRGGGRQIGLQKAFHRPVTRPGPRFWRSSLPTHSIPDPNHPITLPQPSPNPIQTMGKNCKNRFLTVVVTMARSAPEGLPQACHTARTAIWAIKPPYTLNTRPKSPLNTPTNPPQTPYKPSAKTAKVDFSLCGRHGQIGPRRPFHRSVTRPGPRFWRSNLPTHPKPDPNHPTTHPPPSPNPPQTIRESGENRFFRPKREIFQVWRVKSVWGHRGAEIFLKNRTFLLHFWTIQSSEIPKMA